MKKHFRGSENKLKKRHFRVAEQWKKREREGKKRNDYSKASFSVMVTLLHSLSTRTTWSDLIPSSCTRTKESEECHLFLSAHHHCSDPAGLPRPNHLSPPGIYLLFPKAVSYTRGQDHHLEYLC